MNEWSPGGNFSRPGTPIQTGRSYRSQWEDAERCAKPLIVNLRSGADHKARPSFQQYSMEDITKTSLTTNSRNKKVGNGVSDPRFKRVISQGPLNDACVGTEVKTPKAASVLQEKECLKPKIPIWNNPEGKGLQPWSNIAENKESVKANEILYGEEHSFCENSVGADTTNYDQSHDHLKAVDKLKFSHDIIVKSFSKESLSDCTVNTRNTSLASEDLVDEFPNEVTTFPSATRVKKVQNWMQDNKRKPEKKQSVITVIGQTQGPDSISSALQEIVKRRKLVKELDKYAVCAKIIDSDKEKEISHLVAEINGLAPSGKIIYSEGKPYGAKENSNNISRRDGKLHGDSGKNYDPPENDCGLNIINRGKEGKEVDNDKTVPVTGKRSSLKKKNKKGHLVNECPVKGKIREITTKVQYQWAFCFIVILSGALCWFTYFSFQNGPYAFDLFTPKPKTMTLYEKICNWLWELFRPSGNYRRTGPWNPY